ncbi:MAG: Rrf2 family transcriptional regulator [Acidobacteriota bacterium]
MQLSLHADYALRVLIYLGANDGAVVSTRQISDAYGISKHHLSRVVQTLGTHGYVELLTGRGGGVRLKKSPAEIRLGDVVRETEANLNLVECFDPVTNTCPIAHTCGLQSCLREALTAFIDSLNQHTLAELLVADRRSALSAAFIEVRGRATGPPSADRRSTG